MATQLAEETRRAHGAATSGGGSNSPSGALIAIVGCDGSGKTRLATDVVAVLRQQHPVRHRYMGLISGEVGELIRKMPVLGPALERYLAARIRRAQDMEKKLPGNMTAVTMYLLSRWRGWRLRRLMRIVRNGALVIAERYPQAEIAGFHYDGPGLSAGRSSSRLIRKLAAHEQKLYDAMAELKPTLIIRLGVDTETAFARKPDHPRAELDDKIKTMKKLHYNHANIVDIDSCQPYEQVLKTALQQIDRALVS